MTSGCNNEGGQSSSSPDGKYEASVTRYGGEQAGVYLSVIEKSSGKTVWKHREYTRNTPPYGQGLGNLEMVQWSSDSLELRFAVRERSPGVFSAWISTSLNSSGVFSTGIETSKGLRVVDRTQQTPAGSKNSAENSAGKDK